MLVFFAISKPLSRVSFLVLAIVIMGSLISKWFVIIKVWLPDTTKFPEIVISFVKTVSFILIFCKTFKLAFIVLFPSIVTFWKVDWLFLAVKFLLIVKSLINEVLIIELPETLRFLWINTFWLIIELP